MKLSPQQALDTINADLLKAFRSPIGDAVATKLASESAQRFVQEGIDAMLERAHIDARVQFSVTHDPKTGTFMAFLKGTF